MQHNQVATDKPGAANPRERLTSAWPAGVIAATVLCAAGVAYALLIPYLPDPGHEFTALLDFLVFVLLTLPLLYLIVFRPIHSRVREYESTAQELQAATNRLHHIMDVSKDFIFCVDRDGRLTFFNAVAHSLTGYGAEALEGMPFAELCAPEFRAFVVDQLNDQLAGADVEQPSYVDLLRSDGRRVKVELLTSAVQRDHRITGIQGVARDISQHRKAELRLAQLNRAFLQLGPDVEENFRLFIKTCGKLLEGDYATYCHAQDGRVVCVAGWNLPAQLERAAPASERVCSEVMSDRRTPDVVVIPDLGATPFAESDPNVSRFGAATCVGYPVVCDDDIAGAICVWFRSNVELTDDDRRVLRIVGRAIAAEERRYRALGEVRHLARFPDESPYPVLRVDADGTLLYANKQSRPLLDEWDCAVRQKVVSSVCSMVSQVLAAEACRDVEVPVGQQTYMLNFAPVLDAGYVNVYGYDITHRRRVEAELEAREHAMRSLYEVTAHPNMGFDEKLRALLAIGCAQTRLSTGVLGETDTDSDVYRVVAAHSPEDHLQAGDTVKLSQTYCERTVRSSEPVCIDRVSGTEWEQHPAHFVFGTEAYLGTRVFVGGKVYGTLSFKSTEPRPAPFRSLHFIMVRLTAQWIGNELERRQAERQIKQLSLVATRTDNLVIITDNTFAVEWVNEAFTRVLGYRLTECAGRNPFDLLRGEDTDTEALEQVRTRLNDGEGFNVELRLYDRLGRGYWMDMEARPIISGDGTAGNYIVVTRDITERKQAEQAIAHARQQEHEIAFEIQKTLLQGRTPQRLQGLQTAAVARPSQQVSGDFYDFVRYNRTCLDVMVGDVMGKGIPAALLGAGSKSQFLHSLSELSLASGKQDSIPSPGSVMAGMQAGLVDELMNLNSFVTLSLARFDTDAMTMRLVDCGHTRTILYRARTGECEFVQGTNMPLGFVEQDQFEEILRPLNQDDIVVFYSDGLTEVQDERGHMLGDERLAELVSAYPDLTAAEIVEALCADVVQLAGGDDFRDDVTCVVVKMNDAGEGS